MSYKCSQETKLRLQNTVNLKQINVVFIDFRNDIYAKKSLKGNKNKTEKTFASNVPMQHKPTIIKEF